MTEPEPRTFMGSRPELHVDHTLAVQMVSHSLQLTTFAKIKLIKLNEKNQSLNSEWACKRIFFFGKKGDLTKARIPVQQICTSDPIDLWLVSVDLLGLLH